MRNPKKLLLLCMFSLIATVLALADPYDLSGVQASKKILNVIEKDLVTWVNDPVIVAAINKANSENKNRTQATIDRLDKEWRAVKGIDANIKKYLENDAAMFLKRKQSESPYYAEIFIMDYQGCNVAQSDKTSDFWQGDEAKFQKSYNNGKGAVFADAVEFDESAQTYLIQVSLPVVDPATKQVIGAMTVGIDLDNL